MKGCGSFEGGGMDYEGYAEEKMMGSRGCKGGYPA